MMKTTQRRLRNDITDRLDLAGQWRVVIEGEVSPRAVVVVDVLIEDAAQMIFAEGDDVVGALAADATFRLSGKHRRRFDFLGSTGVVSTFWEAQVGPEFRESESPGFKVCYRATTAWHLHGRHPLL